MSSQEKYILLTVSFPTLIKKKLSKLALDSISCFLMDFRGLERSLIHILLSAYHRGTATLTETNGNNFWTVQLLNDFLPAQFLDFFERQLCVIFVEENSTGVNKLALNFM